MPTRWYVQRASVLRSFSKRSALTDEAMAVAAKRVRRIYAKFLDGNEGPLTGYFLKHAPSLVRARSPEDRLAYARWRLRNTRFCKQSMYWQPDGCMYCNLAQLCPHCWGRSAGEAWDRIANFLFPLRADGTRSQVAAYDVVTATRRILHAGNLEPFLRYRLASRKPAAGEASEHVQPRWREMAKLRHLAAYDLIATQTVAVKVGGRVVPQFMSVVRQLFALRPDESLGEHPPSPAMSAPELKRHPTPTRLAAADLVAEFCRYPRGLIVPPRGISPQLHGKGVAYFLDLRHRRQLWAAYGGFRDGKLKGPAAAGAGPENASDKKKVRRSRKKAAEVVVAPPVDDSDGEVF